MSLTASLPFPLDPSIHPHPYILLLVPLSPAPPPCQPTKHLAHLIRIEALNLHLSLVDSMSPLHPSPAMLFYSITTLTQILARTPSSNPIGGFTTAKQSHIRSTIECLNPLPLISTGHRASEGIMKLSLELASREVGLLKNLTESGSSGASRVDYNFTMLQWRCRHGCLMVLRCCNTKNICDGFGGG